MIDPNKEAIRFQIQVKGGARYRHALTLAAKEQKEIVIDLAKVAAGGNNLREIAEVNFICRGSGKKLAVFFDNFRLEK